MSSIALGITGSHRCKWKGVYFEKGVFGLPKILKGRMKILSAGLVLERLEERESIELELLYRLRYGLEGIGNT